MSNYVESGLVEPAYGRFSRRIRAVVIDWIIIMLLLVTALFLAISMNSDRIGRILAFTFVGIWLLYEPLLVSIAGSTIGHFRANLRVVDNRTDGNISFVKAVVRVIIKGVLGIYSFITMATTSRHQALHDLLTHNRANSRSLQGQPTSLRARTHGTIESSYALSLAAYPGYHSLSSGCLGCRAPRRLRHQASWPFIQRMLYWWSMFSE